MYVAVALAWLTATLVVPAHDRPFAIGSTNGSAWNAAFVFNGTDRLGGKSPEPQQTSYEPGHHYPVATQSQRDHIPIVPPSPTRLLARIGPLSGERLGMELLVALLLGVPALLGDVLPRKGGGSGSDAGPPADPADPSDPSDPADPVDPADPARAPQDTVLTDTVRVRRALAAGLGVWMLTGIVLFSHMTRLHPRYVEGFTPAVAAMLGSGGVGRLRDGAGAPCDAPDHAGDRDRATPSACCTGRPTVWWIVLSGALAAIVLAALARLSASPSAPGSPILTGVLALTLIAILAIPVSVDLRAIRDHVSDAGYVGAAARAKSSGC